MSTTIQIPNGFLTLSDVDFKCPKCECPHEESDWYPQYEKSKNFTIYRSCKGCKTKLGITTNIKGDVVVWLKEDEKKMAERFLTPSRRS